MFVEHLHYLQILNYFELDKLKTFYQELFLIPKNQEKYLLINSFKLTIILT